jgi:hypothetical protein
MMTKAQKATKPDVDPCICAECGSLNVQYAVWMSANTGETHDVFGSWNAGDNTFCEDCDMEGRDPNPRLMHQSENPKEYKRLRVLRVKEETKANG